jgi:hypothetical protein
MVYDTPTFVANYLRQSSLYNPTWNTQKHFIFFRQYRCSKSTAAMNYFLSNTTNTVIFMTLGDLRIHHTMAVPFSPLHIWIRILVVYVVKISRGRWLEHHRWVRFHRIFVYTCKQSNIMCSCCVWPHRNGLVAGLYINIFFNLSLWTTN